MSFPDSPLDLRTELLLNSVWTNVSDYTEHGPIAIGRGHPDESTTVSPSTLAVTLTDNDGRFATVNPLSPYYPYLMRNVQARVSIPSQVNYLRMEADNASWISTPSSAPLNVAGDLELQVDVKAAYNTSGKAIPLINKWLGASEFSWWAEIGLPGTVNFFRSLSGSDFPVVTSTAPVPRGRFALKVTYASATGVTTFYTAATLAGPWTQLGAAVSFAASGAAFASTTAVVVGAATGTSLTGSVYAAKVLSGIGGTVVASPDFSASTPGNATLTDAQGNVWTLNGTAEFSGRNYRGHFEIPEFPQAQDQSGKTVLTAAAGGGLLRRLGQRSQPVSSAMYRAYTRLTGSLAPVAYWPMEDGSNAQQLASGIGGTAMGFSGSPQLASSSAFACSNPLPVSGNAVFAGSVPAATWTDNVVRWLMQIPAGGEPNGAVIANVATTGTIALLQLVYGTGGTLDLTGYDSSGTQQFTSTATGFSLNGALVRVGVALQNAGGGNLTWSIQTLVPGASAAGAVSGTVAGTIGAVQRVYLDPYAQLASTVLGHCSVQAKWDTLGDLGGALEAWTGEAAGNRMARLCAEEGLQFRGQGNLPATVLMGIQTPQTLTALLQECADADRGVWHETRQCLGFGYITRAALYNQAAAVTLDYAQDHLSMWPTPPKEDDKDVQNDVTVQQSSGGSSSRQFAAPGQPVTGGRLSTLAPPNGCGTYDQSYTLNLANASDLDNEASWLVHLGTVDRQRYPAILIDLSNRDLASLFWQVLDMDLGDRLVINNPPAWLGADPVSQLCQQLSETLWTKTLEITVCGVPELPYEVAQDGAGFHIDTDGTTLSAGVASGATSMSFATAAGEPLWSTAGGDYPLDVAISGERVTVTAMSGSSSPQTATVTRSVNGVVKAQASGAAVALWNTPVAAL